MAKKLYKADRDFDHFHVGEVVELDEDNPYVRTGYLHEWEPEAAPGGPEEPPALAETTVEPVTDGPAPADEEEPDGDDEGPAETRPKPRTRNRG